MKTAVILMAYGAPERSDQAEPYLCNLLGRKPSPELVLNLTRRYDLIGGRSPLNQIVDQQAQALSKKLTMQVYPGYRFWGDSIQEAVDKARADGVERIVGLALTPYESTRALGAYRYDFTQAVGTTPHVMVGPWPTEPHWIKCWASKIPKGSTVLFTAHSLPVAGSVCYMEGLNACMNEICKQAGVLPRLAFQSRPPSPGAWLEPTIEQILPTLPKGEVLVASIGFVSDHLEILYDLDILHREQAEKVGLIWKRLAMPNAEPLFVESMASCVDCAMEHAGWE